MKWGELHSAPDETPSTAPVCCNYKIKYYIHESQPSYLSVRYILELTYYFYITSIEKLTKLHLRRGVSAPNEVQCISRTLSDIYMSEPCFTLQK